MKKKFYLTLSIILFSLSSNAQLFNNNITFGMTKHIADSVYKNEAIKSKSRLSYFNLPFCGVDLKTRLKYNDDDDLIYNGPVRQLEYQLNFESMEDVVNEKNLNPSIEEKQFLKDEYLDNFVVYFDSAKFIRSLYPYAIDTSLFLNIEKYIIQQGFDLDSVIENDKNDVFPEKKFCFSKFNHIIILSRLKKLFEPNYLYNFWHYGAVSIIEKSPNYNAMVDEEKSKNLSLLNKDNIFRPFSVTSSYDKEKKLSEKEIKITIRLSEYDRKCMEYKPVGIDYIEGAFVIKDVFGKVLHTINNIQIDVKTCMPTYKGNGTRLIMKNTYQYKYKPNEDWELEFLNHLAQNYDIETKFKVNKIKFADGEVWED